jgi:hypothetical protein
MVRNDRVSPNEAALAFHARFLAGAIAYRRGDVNAAIAHFRLAINTVNYLIAAPDSTGLGAPGNFQRIEVGLGENACVTGEGESITSLDAYAGLVAAYMAAPGFTDPSRLPPEVRRTRLQIDPDDPFRPVLRYASSVVNRPTRSPIPENLLWAASNLQRIYHYNRLRPDPRLEVTRAVLLLQLTSQPPWVEAMSASGETDVCAMLGRVGQQLQQQASYRAISTSRALPTDSASAAVAIHTFARLDTDCDRTREPPPADVRSVWLREGSTLAGGDIATHYERLRTSVENALRATNASTDVIAERVAPALEQAETHLEILSSGRVPPDLPATLDAGRAADFVRDWWDALFYDIGDALANAGSELPAATPGVIRATPAVRIQAGDAPALLDAMNSAIAHAHLRPADFYAPMEFRRVARAGGSAEHFAYRVRYAVQSNRGGTIVGLALLFVVLAVGVLVIHVSWWRYDLLVRRRLYQAEAGRRGVSSR